MSTSVLTLSDIDIDPVRTLLAHYQLKLVITDQESIPGSYWGDEEAGLIGNKVYARMETPIHSILHESCHFICMDNERRQQLHTNAQGDYAEENAVCYLQILLAEQIPEMGQYRMMQDMDSWGYSFRLGSSKAWFEQDAGDARQWLVRHQIINQQQPTFRLRQ